MTEPSVGNLCKAVDLVECHPGPFIGTDAELARACAIVTILHYGDDDPHTRQRIIKNGIWNDHIAVQTALTAIHSIRKAAASGTAGGDEMVLHQLYKIREWDEALAVLGIQDSDQTPADAIRERDAEIEQLRSTIQGVVDECKRWQNTQPASADIPLAQPEARGEASAWLVESRLSKEVFLHHHNASAAFNDWGSRISPLYTRTSPGTKP